MPEAKSPRQVVLDTFAARFSYINELCRTRVQAGVVSVRHKTPPVVGRSLMGLNPYRTVQWGGENVYIDYRTVGNYDDTITSLSDWPTIWAQVARLMVLVTDPKKDGVPHKIRRHLYSTNIDLEEALFEIWYRQSLLWSENRNSSGSQRRHLYVVK